MTLLISLVGRVRLQAGDRIVDEADVGGRQVRLALAYLTSERRRAVSRHALADALWEGEPPRTWEPALRGVMSKVRTVLTEIGLPSDVLTPAFGCYQLHLPPDTIVDIEATAAAAAAAESALAQGDLVQAVEHAQASRAIASQPFLPGEQGEWVESRRAALRSVLIRALDVTAMARLRRGEALQAVVATEQIIGLDPYREPAYRLLMAAHAAGGSRSEALQAYARCRQMLAEELGVDPSAETEAAYVGLLGEEPALNTPTPVVVGAIPADAAPAAPPCLIGRETELATIHALWDRTRGGRRQVLLLSGEAGMGKTALTLQFAAAAHSLGANVLYGRCDRRMVVPFPAFTQALRRYAEVCPGELLASQLPRGSEELARLVPELADLGGAAPVIARGEPQTERHDLYVAVSSFLRAVAAQASTVLVIDDLQWARSDTVTLFGHVVRVLEEMPMLIIGIYRTEEVSANSNLADALTDFAQERDVEHLALGGVDEATVAAFISRSRSERLAARAATLAPVLREETGGNPFFLEEIVASLAEGADAGRESEAAIEGARGHAEIPARVERAIEARVARLPDSAKHVLRGAAVIGQEFDLLLLERVSGLDRDRVLDALEQAAVANLVVEATRIGHYRFVHGLVHDVIYATLSPTRRARFHQLVGEAMEAEDDRSPARLTQVAYHLRLAVPLVPATKAFDCALAAGDAARAQFAYDQAAAWFRQALDLAGEGLAEPNRRTRALVSLAGALRWAGRVSEARAAYLEATDLARALGDAETLADCSLGLGAGGPGISAWVADEVRITLLEESLAALGDHESPLRVAVLAELAKALYFTDEHRRRQALADEALETARRIGQVPVVVSALSASRVLRWGPHNTELRLACAEEMVGLGEASGDSLLSLRAHLSWLPDLAEVGDGAVFIAQLERARSIADELAQPYYRWRTLAWTATRALVEGQWKAAEDAYDQAMSCWPDEPHHDAQAWAQVHRSIGGVVRYEATRAIRDLRAVAEAHPMIPSLRCLLAWALAEAGRREARHEFERFAADGFTSPPLDGQWLAGITALAHTCVALADRSRASALYELLWPFGDRIAVLDAFGGGGAIVGPVAHALGLLAAALGRHDEAAGRLRAAVEISERFGAEVLAARSRQSAARLDGDRARA